MTAKGNAKVILVFIQAIFALVFFSSCQKEITNDAVTSSDSSSFTTTSSKIKTYSEYLSSPSSSLTLQDLFSLSYDAGNRLVSMVSMTNSGNKFMYTYNADKSYSLDIFQANTLSIHEVFFLNSMSLVDSTIQINNSGDTSTEKYLYNANKQLATLKEYFFTAGVPDITTTTSSYDNTGNVIKEVTDNPPSTTTYDYYPNFTNSISIGQQYFYQNKNLVKTATYASGGTTSVGQYTYTFDTQNRLVSQKLVADNGDTVIARYTYY